MEREITDPVPNQEQQDCCNEPSCCGAQIPFARTEAKVGRNDLAPVVTGKNSKNAVDASNESSSRQVYYSPFWFFASDKFFSKSAPSHIFPSTSFCSAAFNLSTKQSPWRWGV